MVDVRNVIIIGSGPAGYTAAIYAARAQLAPLLFEGAVTAGGALMQTTEVENFPGFPEGIMGPDLMMNLQQQAERFGAEILTAKVSRVELSERPYGVSDPLRRVANMSSAAGDDVPDGTDGLADSGLSGPGLVGFEPAAARVASTDRSHAAVLAARLLATTEVKGLSDDECLGVFDDIELIRRSLDAFSAGVAAEIDSRGLCDLRYGSATVAWFERRHGRSRAAVAREVKTGRKLRSELDVIEAAVLRGEICFERAAFIAGKVNPRNAAAFAAAQDALLALSAAEPSWAMFTAAVAALARFFKIAPGETLDDHVWPCAEARDLVGWLVGIADFAPRKRLSTWSVGHGEQSASCWSSVRRARTARDASKIRHWRIIEGDYTDAPDGPATWFIDPPYEIKGAYYVHGSDAIDFPALGEWCQSRTGQVIVCEQVGATWLPFVPFSASRSASTQSKGVSEAIWTRHADPLGALGMASRGHR